MRSVSMALLCAVASTATAQTALQRLRRNILVIDSNHYDLSQQHQTMTRLLDENTASSATARIALEDMEMIERILGGVGSLSLSL
jgi:hypothetical protein